jgi:hypothetical protein
MKVLSASVAGPPAQLACCPAQRIEQDMKELLRSLAFSIVLTGLASFSASAQSDVAAQPRPANSALSDGQLDQLTAPIALYSDPLLGEILTAATYPLEIVEASR